MANPQTATEYGPPCGNCGDCRWCRPCRACPGGDGFMADDKTCAVCNGTGTQPGGPNAPPSPETVVERPVFNLDLEPDASIYSNMVGALAPFSRERFEAMAAEVVRGPDAPLVFATPEPVPPYGSIARIAMRIQEECDHLMPALIPRGRLRVGIVDKGGSMLTADGAVWVRAEKAEGRNAYEAALSALVESDPDWARAVLGGRR